MAGIAAHRPTAEQWRQALPDLRRVGGEWHGPCPACGGDDRFRLMPSGMVFCRQCCPSADDKDAYRAILRAAGFDRPTDPKWSPLRSPAAPTGSPKRKAEPRPSRTACQAAGILARAVFADDSPASRYLARRGTWPASAGILPKAVRWIPRGVLQGTVQVSPLPVRSCRCCGVRPGLPGRGA